MDTMDTIETMDTIDAIETTAIMRFLKNISFFFLTFAAVNQNISIKIMDDYPADSSNY